jgi:hypothetical protein
MPVWVWIVITAAIVIAAVVILVGASSRRRTQRLRERFGPEYDRMVVQAGGQKAAEEELASRERNRDKLDIRPLRPEAFAVYARRWQSVQTAFVDNPPNALGDADRLVTELMHERGYPVDDFDQQAADISVDHPVVVENYRAAHNIHLSQQDSDVGTEAQRQAFIHYRALFEKLLEVQTDSARSQEASS